MIVISQRFTKSRIWDVCRQYGCTTFSLLGGMMSGIFNEPPRRDDAANPVRVVISAGTPRAIWEDFEERFDVSILEWYGAIEGGLAYKPVGVGPIESFGKPIPGVMQMKVADEDANEVPPGQTGELISRMAIQSKNKVDYYKKPEASAEKMRAAGSTPATSYTGTRTAGSSSATARVALCVVKATSSNPPWLKESSANCPKCWKYVSMGFL